MRLPPAFLGYLVQAWTARRTRTAQAPNGAGCPAEVRGRFVMQSTGGPLEGAMIRCPVGHWFTGPIESLTLTTGPGHAAALPCLAGQGGGQTERPP
jgi:hypothetical protein